MFIDTHCHISKDYYSDIDRLIKDNISANVNKIIVSGCTFDSINETIELINKYKELYATIGFHPSEVKSIKNNDLIWLEKSILFNKKIVGLGEIGLDYYYEKDSKNEQIELFEKQLQIAERLQIPVVIHSRDATEDTIKILKKYKVIGVIHCFSGSIETANIYIKMGYKLGIGGVLTFKNNNLVNVISNIDIKNIVLETDSPYLTPVPYRGSINSSKYIPIIANKIANIKQLTIDDVETITTKNVNDVFILN